MSLNRGSRRILFNCSVALINFGLPIIFLGRGFAVRASGRKPKVVFVLGGPGAGKGTLCASIAKEFDMGHLSGGDLLREERTKPGSKYGQLIDDHIKNSKIVPVEITLSLLDAAMQSSKKEIFLIDGFPRNKNNQEGWDKAMSGKADLLFVLLVHVDDETSAKRCLRRGQMGSGRTDDNAQVIKLRIKTFHDETKPVLDHYEKLKLLRKVDGSKPMEGVFAEAKLLFKKELGK